MLIQEIFINSNLPLTQNSTDFIIEILKLQYNYNISNQDYTGLIFTGYGDLDIFPKLKEIRIYTKVNGKVTYSYINSVEISDSSSWEVIPFAQSNIVFNLAKGIDPIIQDGFSEDFKRIISANVQDENLKNLLINQIEQNLKFHIDKYTDAMQGVTFLPLKELGTTAETLVDLTTFKKRVTIDKETVGGNTDVAIISKCEGLVWFKREHYFEQNLNYHFFK